MTKLYTDTSANLPLALLREYDIAVIPFSYTVNGVAEDYNEETDFDGKAFYDAMRRGAEVKTSMVNPATAAAFFERALAQGDDVLYVGMSGGISGTAPPRSARACRCSRRRSCCARARALRRSVTAFSRAAPTCASSSRWTI